MGLSCGCGEYYPDPGEKYYYVNEDYSTLNSSRRKRCTSCKELINIGSTVVKVERFKVPDHDVEIAIYGDEGEIPLAAHYMCEQCGDLALNLLERGYCFNVYDDMKDLLEEYKRLVAESHTRKSSVS